MAKDSNLLTFIPRPKGQGKRETLFLLYLLMHGKLFDAYNKALSKIAVL